MLLLGVTNSGTEGLTTIEPSQQLILERGAGSFELSMTMPAKGWPHVTFYDPRGWQSLRGHLLRRGRERPA